MLLQDRGIEKWLVPDADKWYSFTHVFPLLPLDKQSLLAGFSFFFFLVTVFFRLLPYSPFNPSKATLLECLFVYWHFKLKIYFKLLDSKLQPPEG